MVQDSSGLRSDNGQSNKSVKAFAHSPIKLLPLQSLTYIYIYYSSYGNLLRSIFICSFIAWVGAKILSQHYQLIL